MAHRYLYYVMARPVITDQAYDALEAQATKRYDPDTGNMILLLPDDHPLNKPGSDNPKSYTTYQIRLAKKLSKGSEE